MAFEQSNHYRQEREDLGVHLRQAIKIGPMLMPQKTVAKLP